MFIKLNSHIQEISEQEKKLSKSLEKYLNKDKFTKCSGLTKLYLIALSTVAGLSISGQCLIQWMLIQQSNDANKINIASTERTLSQQLSKAALVIDFATDPILETQSLVELKTVTQQLQNFHISLKEKNNSEIITNLFTEVENNYQALIT